jgi:hypothetical protein
MSVHAFDPTAEPAIWLYRTHESRRSKFGGLPNLPAWISWPRRELTADRIVDEFADLPPSASSQADTAQCPTVHIRNLKRSSWNS